MKQFVDIVRGNSEKTQLEIQGALADLTDQSFEISLSVLPLSIEGLAVLGSRGFVHALVGERAPNESGMVVSYRYLAFGFADDGRISKLSVV